MDQRSIRSGVFDPGDPRRPGADPATGATVVPIYATSTFTQEAPGPAQGLRVLAQRQPDARGAWKPAWRRSKGASEPWPSPRAWRPPRPCSRRSGPATRSPPPPTSTAGRSACWSASSSPGDWSLATPRIASPEGFAAILSPATKLVWIETPTNPLLQIIDIAAVRRLAHRRGALLVVDNTFASPYLQRPLELGADLVVHSTTKYLGGHSDVIGGAVIGRRDAPRADRLLSERRRRRSRAVRLLARAARHQDAGRPHGAALSERQRARRVARRSTRRSSGSITRACPTTPAIEVAARQMRGFRRHDQHPPARRRARLPRACCRGPASSAWPRASAAWNH